MCNMQSQSLVFYFRRGPKRCLQNKNQKCLEARFCLGVKNNNFKFTFYLISLSYDVLFNNCRLCHKYNLLDLQLHIFQLYNVILISQLRHRFLNQGRQEKLLMEKKNLTFESLLLPQCKLYFLFFFFFYLTLSLFYFATLCLMTF